MQRSFMIFFVLIAASLSCANSYVIQNRNVSSVINPGNGIARGTWGSVALCPPGSYAGQLEIKYEPWGSADVTNTDAVKLYCFDDNWTFVNYVTSTEGTEGTWQGIRSCPQGNFLIGYTMDVTEEQGTFGDDVGVVNVKAECQDGTILDGLNLRTQEKSSVSEEAENEKKMFLVQKLLYRLTDEDREKVDMIVRDLSRPQPSTWGPLATCPAGTRVCGLQTRVEEHSSVADDAGLCDMKFFCCE